METPVAVELGDGQLRRYDVANRGANELVVELRQ
jgi:hypothetical protein